MLKNGRFNNMKVIFDDIKFKFNKQSKDVKWHWCIRNVTQYPIIFVSRNINEYKLKSFLPVNLKHFVTAKQIFKRN